MHALGQWKRGVGISQIKILLAKFPETHGGKQQFQTDSHAGGVVKVFINRN